MVAASFTKFSQIKKHFDDRAKESKDITKWLLRVMSGVLIEDVKDNLKNDSPVHAYITGQLHRSIKRKSLSHKSVTVFGDTDYSYTVHEGLKGRFPKPFLTFTYATNKSKYEKIFKSNIKQYFTG